MQARGECQGLAISLQLRWCWHVRGDASRPPGARTTDGESPCITAVASPEVVTAQNRHFCATLACRQQLGPAFGRTDFSRIFIFEPPDFFADFLVGLFLLIFVGKSAQKNPPGKSPGKTLQNFSNKNPPTHFCRLPRATADPTLSGKTSQNQAKSGKVRLCPLRLYPPTRDPLFQMVVSRRWFDFPRVDDIPYLLDLLFTTRRESPSTVMKPQLKELWVSLWSWRHETLC